METSGFFTCFDGGLEVNGMKLDPIVFTAVCHLHNLNVFGNNLQRDPYTGAQNSSKVSIHIAFSGPTQDKRGNCYLSRAEMKFSGKTV